MSPRIRIDSDLLARFCKDHGICRLAFFGSALRPDFRPDSDVDVLVEFEPGRTPDLFSMAEMQLDLSELLGRQVDLRTPGELSRYFRQEVMLSAEVQYAAS